MLFKKTSHGGVKPGDLTGFIDEASEIEGVYRFSGTVMLNGRFRGELASNDTLIIGDKGVVHANIHAGVVLVSGEVVGNIVAADRVELRGHARVTGDIEAPVVTVEEGVFFEGRCRMTRAQQPAREAPPALAVVPAAN
ncbi:MAG TPA: polymer-forming cytoskeletal protein [Candidatus Tectomicrobia bacterium]|nr:polymer-forming cytoskeletal protein [Candidatus Tectomicrobia bacterium]